MGLVKLLSSEPLPLTPTGQGPAVEKYVRDLHNYLRRLGTRFTGENITRTLEEEGGYQEVDKWVHVETNSNWWVDERDWRGGILETILIFNHEEDDPNGVVATHVLSSRLLVGADWDGSRNLVSGGGGVIAVNLRIFGSEGGKLNLEVYGLPEDVWTDIRFWVRKTPTKRAPDLSV